MLSGKNCLLIRFHWGWCVCCVLKNANHLAAVHVSVLLTVCLLGSSTSLMETADGSWRCFVDAYDCVDVDDDSDE